MASLNRFKLKKFQALLRELHSLQSVAIAFSGGLDSTFLLHAARLVLEYNDVLAITCVTPYMPKSEIEEAGRTAAAINVRHQVLTVPFPEELRTNPPDRCYLCKRALFTQLAAVARRERIPHLLDGTNRDDLDDYRPGRRALDELGVKSPLLMADLTKQDIRDLAKENGLAWDKPAGACLLTRIPHDTRIESEELRRIDVSEDFLKELGFNTVRIRSHGDLASIEVPYERVAALVAADRRHGIDIQLKALGYRYVTVNLAGYRMGSLNELPTRRGKREEHGHTGTVETPADRDPKRQPGRGTRDGTAARFSLSGHRPHQDRFAP